jgi:hypothetical protein
VDHSFEVSLELDIFVHQLLADGRCDLQIVVHVVGFLFRLVFFRERSLRLEVQSEVGHQRVNDPPLLRMQLPQILRSTLIRLTQRVADNTALTVSRSATLSAPAIILKLFDRCC